MSKSNVYVVLASIHSKNKDQVNVQFFEYADAINRRYLAPFEDLDVHENDVSPNEGRWRFQAVPEGDWKPFGKFVSVNEDCAVSVVHKTAPGSHTQARKGAERWLKARDINLSPGAEKLSLHR